MTFTLVTVAQIVAILAALLAFIKMCWSVAAFAIGAQKNIESLTATVEKLNQTVEKLEANLDSNIVEMRTRILALETKEAIRTATEHIHDMEGKHGL